MVPLTLDPILWLIIMIHIALSVMVNTQSTFQYIITPADLNFQVSFPVQAVVTALEHYITDNTFQCPIAGYPLLHGRSEQSRVRCPSQGHNVVRGHNLNPRPFVLKSSTLTDRLPTPHYVNIVIISQKQCPRNDIIMQCIQHRRSSWYVSRNEQKIVGDAVLP
jgi:hypothetical protein